MTTTTEKLTPADAAAAGLGTILVDDAGWYFQKQDIPPRIRDIVRSAPAGDYQEDLISGREPWSGAGLRGKARDWSSSYARSRAGLVARINKLVRHDGWQAGTEIIKFEGRRRRVLILRDEKGRPYIWG